MLARAPLVRLLDVELIGATLPLPRGLVLLELGGESLVLELDNYIFEVPAGGQCPTAKAKTPTKNHLALRVDLHIGRVELSQNYY